MTVVSKHSRKRKRLLKITAQIVSTVLTVFFVYLFYLGAMPTDVRYVPDEEVNLYKINEDYVYELKDIEVIEKYFSDEYLSYYLVAFPFKDESIKVASLCANSSFDFFIDEDLNSNTEKCIIEIGATIDYTDLLTDDVKLQYDKAVENLKNSRKNTVSTELSLNYTCEANRTSFDEYANTVKSDDCFSFIVFAALVAFGIVLMIVSFIDTRHGLEIECDGTVYYVPETRNKS